MSSPESKDTGAADGPPAVTVSGADGTDEKTVFRPKLLDGGTTPDSVLTPKGTRFVVSKPTDHEMLPLGEMSGPMRAPQQYGSLDQAEESGDHDVDFVQNSQQDIYHLYGEDHQRAKRPLLKSFLSTIGDYRASIPTSADAQKGARAPGSLGTILGVYFPCIQNIFGVILFIRLAWIVGVAGWLQSFLMVFLCCACTLLTSISMSAIATNGKVPGGGSYFMISRNLGPEFGGAVGIFFYLGTSIAASMYIIGAVEILLKYFNPLSTLIAVPPWNDLSDLDSYFPNYRIYGTLLLLLLLGCVMIGVKFVSKFAPISLACVLLSILAIYIGFFASTAKLDMCLYNGNPIKSMWLDTWLKKSTPNLPDMPSSSGACNSCPNGAFFKYFCRSLNGSEIVDLIGDNSTGWGGSSGFNGDFKSCAYDHMRVIDTQCPGFGQGKISTKPGITGITSGVFGGNIKPYYPTAGRNLIDDPEKKSSFPGQIFTEESSSFILLMAIFFPSVTGIMAGSNRSGDLANAQRSIPIGTVCAIATTSFVYLSCILFFAAVVDGSLLRDKFGESISEKLVVANIAWPNEWVILIGALLSTIGAGLQSLTGAPRLLQAIAQDAVIPILAPLRVLKRGEPLYCQLVTACIVEIGILIANIDKINPIITNCFLMCYAGVNMACAVQSILKSPNWRPRFRFYHWSLSALGLLLCLVIMFISGWYYALGVLAVAFAVFKYIEYKGAEKEWGDGIRGVSMQAARYALLRLERGPPHVKNWRPQLLIFVKPDEELNIRHPALFQFIRHLKYGKGLVIVGSILEGSFVERRAQCSAFRNSIRDTLRAQKIDGFANVCVAPTLGEGFNAQIQLSGLGGMHPNCVVVGWPYRWRSRTDTSRLNSFIDLIRVVHADQKALLVLRGLDRLEDKQKILTGTIDVWWIVHDGGLLILLPFLMMQHKKWRNCRLRIFAVAQEEDNSIQMKKDLERFIYELRIKAEVSIVEMQTGDISAYTYERTMMMQERSTMLQKLRDSKVIRSTREAEKDPQYHLEMFRKRTESVPVDEEALAVDFDEESAGVESPDEEKLRVNDETMPLSPGQVATESKSTGQANLSETRQPRVGGLAVEKSKSDAQFTFTPSDGKELMQKLRSLKPETRHAVRRMHTAVALNETILSRSQNAELVILNLPGPSKKSAGDLNYMEYLEVLSEGMDRVILVRGGGREVITIYS